MKPDKPFDCDLCGKSFRVKSDVTRHMRIHTGEKPYKCDICEKTYTRKDMLTDHQRNHTGEKPHSCDMCEKAFGKKNDLDRHKRIHTGEKPFVCDICKRIFSAKGTLTIHKRLHTGEKPYKCDLCEKTFSQSGTLSVHKIMHTGTKQYSCEICQKFYTDRSSLLRHSKSAAHIKTLEDKSSTNLKNFVDCDDIIKTEMIKEEINEEESVEDHISIPQEIDGMRLFSCDICKENFTERIVLMMHKDINHSQPIQQSVENPLPIDNYTGSDVKQEVKEEVNDSDEGQGVEDFNPDTNHLVDCSQYLQVQINLTK